MVAILWWRECISQYLERSKTTDETFTLETVAKPLKDCWNVTILPSNARQLCAAIKHFCTLLKMNALEHNKAIPVFLPHNNEVYAGSKTFAVSF